LVTAGVVVGSTVGVDVMGKTAQSWLVPGASAIIFILATATIVEKSFL